MLEVLPAKISYENLGRFNVTRKDQLLVLPLGFLCTLVQYTRIYFVPYSMSAQLVSSCGSMYDYKNCNLTILKSIKGYLLGVFLSSNDCSQMGWSFCPEKACIYKLHLARLSTQDGSWAVTAELQYSSSQNPPPPPPSVA